MLAHEIGHVVGRHSANQLATRFGLELLAAIALGEEPALLAEAAADLAEAGGMAAFSREDEREADRYGVAYTIAAGYDPRGLITFFTKLLEAESGGRRGLRKADVHHPATAERIRDIEKRITRAGDPGGRLEAERFQRMRARLERGYAAAVDDASDGPTFGTMRTRDTHSGHRQQGQRVESPPGWDCPCSLF